MLNNATALSERGEVQCLEVASALSPVSQSLVKLFVKLPEKEPLQLI